MGESSKNYGEDYQFACLSVLCPDVSLVLGTTVYIMRSLGTAIAAEAFTNKAPFSLPTVVYSINTPHVCCV